MSVWCVFDLITKNRVKPPLGLLLLPKDAFFFWFFFHQLTYLVFPYAFISLKSAEGGMQRGQPSVLEPKTTILYPNL